MSLFRRFIAIFKTLLALHRALSKSTRTGLQKATRGTYSFILAAIRRRGADSESDCRPLPDSRPARKSGDQFSDVGQDEPNPYYRSDASVGGGSGYTNIDTTMPPIATIIGSGTEEPTSEDPSISRPVVSTLACSHLPRSPYMNANRPHFTTTYLHTGGTHPARQAHMMRVAARRSRLSLQESVLAPVEEGPPSTRLARNPAHFDIEMQAYPMFTGVSRLNNIQQLGHDRIFPIIPEFFQRYDRSSFA